MAKLWCPFAQLYDTKSSTDLLFWKYRLWVDFKIESVFFLLSQKQTKHKNKFLYIYIAMKKLEELQLTLINSKFEAGKGDY